MSRGQVFAGGERFRRIHRTVAPGFEVGDVAVAPSRLFAQALAMDGDASRRQRRAAMAR